MSSFYSSLCGVREHEIVIILGLPLIHTSDSGQQLRHDDPAALKDIIEIVQKKVAQKDDKDLRYLQL
jgi:nucleolar MIF4G domain-containing protein 1